MLKSSSTVLLLLASVLLVLSGINPDHFPPWTSYHTEVPAFAAAVLLLVACMRRGGLAVGPPVLLLLVLIGTAWLQWWAGLVVFAGDAWVVTAYLLVFAASWMWGAQASNEQGRTRPLEVIAATLVILGLLAAFQSLVQWFQLEGHFAGWVFQPANTTRAAGNFGQPNQTATLLLMGLAAGAMLMHGRQIGMVAGWAWLVLGGWALVLTQSRTGLLSAVLMVAAVVALGWARQGLRRYVWHAAAWLIYVLAATWLLHAVQWEWTRGALSADAMSSVGLRPVIWRQLLVALRDSPWIGYGWLQISAAQQAGAASVAGVEQVNYAHNVLLDLAVMLGVPAALGTTVLALVWIAKRLVRVNSAAAFAPLFILLPLIVHTQLELPHAYAYFLVLAGMLMGFFDGTTRLGSERAIRVPATVIGAAALLAIAMFGALASEYAAAEEDFRVNRFENRRLGHTPSEYVSPHLVMLTQLDEMLRAMRLRARRNMPADDLDVLVKASRRYTWAPLQFRTAMALGLNGRPKQAEEHLQVIQSMFPPSVSAEGRADWMQMQAQDYPELAAVPFPAAR